MKPTVSSLFVVLMLLVDARSVYGDEVDCRDSSQLFGQIHEGQGTYNHCAWDPNNEGKPPLTLSQPAVVNLKD